MSWADVGIIAIFIAGIMSLTRSSLSRTVFVYLIGVLLIQSIASELHPEGKLKVFPAIPITIIFQWAILTFLDKSYIRAKVTPIVIGIAMLFEAVCITENLLGARYIVLWYGMVLGVTSLLAALEGAVYGGSSILSKFTSWDRRNRFRYSWLFQAGMPFNKKD